MKKVVAILLMTLMLVMLMFGCVARNDYDALMAEYDTVCTRVTSLQGDLTTAWSQTETLQSDLTAEQSKSGKLAGDLTVEQSRAETLASDLAAEESESNKLAGDLATAQSKARKLEGDYDALKQKVDKAEPYAEILDKFLFIPEETEFTAGMLLELTSLVTATGSAEIEEKYTAWMEATTERKAIERYGEFCTAVWDGLWALLYPGKIESQ